MRPHQQADPERTGELFAGAESYSTEQKLGIFRSLFRGRTDVYPVRWESPRRGTSGYMPDCSNKFAPLLCNIRTTTCSKCEHRAFRPLDDDAIARHLRGQHTIGIYPLMTDNRCWFLALDFDKKAWRKDVVAARHACSRLGLAAYVERSRSGNGAHLWLFFVEPVLARQARELGSTVLASAQELRPSLALRSYDRMFPSQDALAEGGFGNLIALPLQRGPRGDGNSVFLDDALEPYPGEEQWELLAGVRRLSSQQVETVIASRRSEYQAPLAAPQPTRGWRTGSLFAKPEAARPQDSSSLAAVGRASAQGRLSITIADRIYIDRDSIPAGLLTQIRNLATFSNPDYFRKKAAHASTWNTPRVIRCSEHISSSVALPRGCEAALLDLATKHDLDIKRIDQRTCGTDINATFQGLLTPIQSEALAAIMAHDIGVLVLPTGVGKTVVATAAIAKRACSTLVIVNRRPLLEQWRAQLALFLGDDESDIGQVGAGKRHVTGRIDVAMMQSLSGGGVIQLPEYGHVIVDECHHVAASSFERVLASLPARFLLGLTATPRRRDGHHPIVHMQLGPIRFEASAKLAARECPFSHRYFVRHTELRCNAPEPSVTELQALISEDERRNSFILDDTVAALRYGRSPLVLCQRREHVLLLADRLERYAPNLFVLLGGMKARQQREAFERLRALDPAEQRLIIATGKFVGEGFDDARLDTLLLAAPISWKGTLAQYAGRLHRLHPDKHEVWIFDYLDQELPVLARMFEKRRRGYRSLGYEAGDPPHDFELLTDPAEDGDAYWFDQDLPQFPLSQA